MRLFFLLLLVLISSFSAVPAEVRETCRTIASEYVQEPGSILVNCRFDRLRFVCEKSNGEIESEIFASRQDFILEVLQRNRTYALLSRKTTALGLTSTTDYQYNADGLFSGQSSVESPNWKFIWNRWDLQGRNTGGYIDTNGTCPNIEIQVEYKDQGRFTSALFGHTNPTLPERCQILKMQVDRWYDENYVMIREVTKTANGEKEETKTVRKTERVCMPS